MFQYFIALVVFISIIANVPQIIKTLKCKKSHELSLWTWIMWSIVTGSMAIHAWQIQDYFFFISQTGQFLLDVFLVILILKYYEN